MILFGCIIIFWMLLSAARAARPVHRMIVCLRFVPPNLCLGADDDGGSISYLFLRGI